MNFVYPAFLWALAALAIPIIVHLFNFRKTIRVYFSTTRFLRQVKEETTQKRKLKQYLILASRLLFLTFLVFAFAQPFLPAPEQLDAGKNKVLYLDNSFSMSVPAEDKLRVLDHAVLMAQQLIGVFPADTRYRLVTNDFSPSSNGYKTKTEIEDLLAQIRLSPISRTADEVKNRLTNGTDEVYWFSDFQQSTWGAEDGLFDSARQWHLIPLEGRTGTNVYVDSLYLENPFVVGGERNAIRVRLRNDGVQRQESLVVKLAINGVQAATTTVALDPSSTAELNFDLSSGLNGLNRGVITFNDFPVSFDNEFYFTINFSRTLRVVEIKEDRNTTFVERVFGNRQLFQIRSFRTDNIDYSSLPQSDLIVLNSVNKIDASLGTSLQTFQEQGGVVLLVPSMQGDLASYQQVLRLPPLQWLGAGEQTELDKPDYRHPLFENLFEEQSTRVAMPRAVRSLDWGTDPSAILRFKDGTPYLSRFRQTYVLASPLDKSATDFYTHALFVPVMYRLAATGRRTESRPYYFITQSTLEVKADSLEGEEPVRLAGSTELVPPQRKAPDGVVMDLPKFSMAAGFYNVLFRKDTIDEVAFNLEHAESRLAATSPEELTKKYAAPHVSVMTTSSPTSFGNEIKDRYLGTPLWKQALLLSLLFLLAEVLLIRFWK